MNIISKKLVCIETFHLFVEKRKEKEFLSANL